MTHGHPGQRRQPPKHPGDEHDQDVLEGGGSLPSFLQISEPLISGREASSSTRSGSSSFIAFASASFPLAGDFDATAVSGLDDPSDQVEDVLVVVDDQHDPPVGPGAEAADLFLVIGGVAIVQRDLHGRARGRGRRLARNPGRANGEALRFSVAGEFVADPEGCRHGRQRRRPRRSPDRAGSTTPHAGPAAFPLMRRTSSRDPLVMRVGHGQDQFVAGGLDRQDVLDLGHFLGNEREDVQPEGRLGQINAGNAELGRQGVNNRLFGGDAQACQELGGESGTSRFGRGKDPDRRRRRQRPRRIGPATLRCAVDSRGWASGRAFHARHSIRPRSVRTNSVPAHQPRAPPKRSPEHQDWPR